eukprot:scaffold17676_cov108-Isochrysis_galbana.AAC.3
MFWPPSPPRRLAGRARRARARTQTRKRCVAKRIRRHHSSPHARARIGRSTWTPGTRHTHTRRAAVVGAVTA